MNKKINITLIVPNPDQPRTVFDQTELEGLAQSIRENGLIQPIVVEEAAGQYILVDGERRLRAHQLAGLKTIDAIVRPTTNHGGLERLTHALVANIQRSAMGPIDEARAYERLIHELGTQDAVARKVGVSTATISGRLALLEFPEEVQRLYNLRRLPVDMKLIADLKQMSPAQMTRVAFKASTRGLTAVGIRKLIAIELKGKRKYTPRKPAQEPVIETNGHFNALSLVNGKELPAGVRTAAVQTCKACALYSEASPTMCRECPLPDLLRRL